MFDIFLTNYLGFTETTIPQNGLWVNSPRGHFHHIFLSTWGVFSKQVQVMCLCLWLRETKPILIIIKKPESAWKLSIGNHIYKKLVPSGLHSFLSNILCFQTKNMEFPLGLKVPFMSLDIQKKYFRISHQLPPS